MTIEVSMATTEKTPETAATPGASAAGSLVSLLIPCCGMLEYTKLCVPSILRTTRTPYELIFIDVGSLDGTAEYLAGVATVHPRLRVEVVRTKTDLDISQACQEAMTRAKGEVIVLLNNDTIVPAGWLNQLLGLLQADPAIGLVGPMSNHASGSQLVEHVPYRIRTKKLAKFEGRYGASEAILDAEAVEGFAREHREANRGKWMFAEQLGGFCLLLKREVIQKVGPLDQWTNLSVFDTNVLGAKAREKGFKLAVCRDLFVHHFGTRTFAQGSQKT